MSFMDDLGLREDKALMQTYINTYGHRDAMPIESYLEEWHRAKSEYLLGLFNHQLILRFPNVKIEKEKQELKEDIESLLYNNKHFMNLESAIRVHSESSRQLSYQLFSGANFTEGYYVFEDRTIYNQDNKKLTIHHKQKIFKAIRRVCKFYKISNYENDLKEAELEYSRIMNDKTVKGTLCLSIHPLDYMTMSDNDYDWHSCMSWITEGCYRAGTVEMMNSPCVIVAYVEGNKKWDLFDNYTWNNKKWRELFIVDKDMIVGIKGYPYPNHNLETVIINILKGMIKDVNYTETKRLLEWHEVAPTFSTELMYNDICANEDCAIALREGYYPPLAHIFNYSGDGYCLICGAPLDDEENVICTDCNENFVVCKCCGERISIDAAVEHEGAYYCDCCFNDNFAICEYCEDTVDLKEIVEITDDKHFTTYYICKNCFKTLLKKYKNELTEINSDHYKYTGKEYLIDC